MYIPWLNKSKLLTVYLRIFNSCVIFASISEFINYFIIAIADNSVLIYKQIKWIFTTTKNIFIEFVKFIICIKFYINEASIRCLSFSINNPVCFKTIIIINTDFVFPRIIDFYSSSPDLQIISSAYNT